MPVNIAANRYKPKRLLGDGGMGVVSRTPDVGTNTYVALETPRIPANPTILQMFKRVRMDSASLPHPNIGDVRDVDEIEEDVVRKPCSITPLLPGTTLAALIKSSSPRLTTDFVVSIIVQVCHGLQAVHEMDLIHGDLKPSNIFIMDDDTVKIIDFGLVYTIENQSANALKRTWQYMSPEQLDGSAPPNRSFDIFSLGIVAYEALALHQPFKRATVEDTAEAIRNFVPQAISERNSKVPQLISKAVHVAISKHPGYRYSTASEFAETLQKAQQNQEIERFDPARIRPRIDSAQRAFDGGDSDFACEILNELAAEGNLGTAVTLLPSQIDDVNKQRRIRQLLATAQTRIEQEKILLALEELDRILELDPQNPDARKLRTQIEEQRSKQHTSEWLHRARETPSRPKNEEPRASGATAFDPELDSYARLLSTPEEAPVVAPPIQPPASPIHPPPLKSPSASGLPRVLQQIREAGQLFVENVESRFGIQYRKVVSVLVGCLASSIILGLTLAYTNRAHPDLVADHQAHKPAVVSQAANIDLSADGGSGTEATTHTGDPASKPVPPAEQDGVIPADGPATNVEDAGSFAIAGGKQSQSPIVDAAKAPRLPITTSARPNASPVGISATPKTAKLFVDDHLVRPQKLGFWLWTATAGVYNGKLTAEGMNDETFTIVLKKGIPFSRRVDMTPKGPPLVPFTITGGTPGSTVSLDDSAIGVLDDKGGLAYSGVARGTHTIQLSKPGYSSRTFYGQVLVPGKAFDLPGDKQLSVEAGYARVTVTPAYATVSYKRSGETDTHPVFDLSKALTLQPGTYEFAAEAPNHSANIIQVKIQPNQTASFSLDLQSIKVKETKMEFVNMDEVIKKNGEWYHGRTDKYIRLMTKDSTNTILFSKEFKVKKMAWQVSLGGNTITYKLDAKGISITRNIDGVETTERVKDDFSSTDNPSALYAATIKLEKNHVIIARPDGTLVNTWDDDKHNWLQAQIFAKGDTYFTLSPGH